ncbi:hypothetical protein AOLI_G00162710 [Acnodon oligacanthus]
MRGSSLHRRPWKRSWRIVPGTWQDECENLRGEISRLSVVLKQELCRLSVGSVMEAASREHVERDVNLQRVVGSSWWVNSQLLLLEAQLTPSSERRHALTLRAPAAWGFSDMNSGCFGWWLMLDASSEDQLERIGARDMRSTSEARAEDRNGCFSGDGEEA